MNDQLKQIQSITKNKILDHPVTVQLNSAGRGNDNVMN